MVAIPSCREFLKHQTRDAHNATDEAMSSHAGVDTLQGYTTFIATMHSLIAAFGPHLDDASCLAGLPHRSERLRRQLELDIEQCGGQLPSGAAAGLVEPCTDLVESFAAGVGYAMEGSALGAEVLRRRVLQASPDAPTAYFDTLLAGRRSRWSRYCSWLEESQQTGAQRHATAQAANQVFSFALQQVHHTTVGQP